MALVAGRGAQHQSLSPSDVAHAAVRVGEPGFADGRLVWVVTPPSASGNAVVVSGTAGEPVRRESPLDGSVRSRLYGYGAASWCATPFGLVGIESSTQQLCRLAPDRLEPVGDAAPPGVTERLGDPTCVPDTSWVICVRERRVATATLVALVAIDVTTGECVELHVSDGLAAEPTVDATTRRVAWLHWPARSMPWDQAALLVALSPGLILAAFVNWDLFAMALAAGGLAAWATPVQCARRVPTSEVDDVSLAGGRRRWRADRVRVRGRRRRARRDARS